MVLPTAEEKPQHAPCTVFTSWFKPLRQIIPDIYLSGKILLQSLWAWATWAIDKQMASPKDLISWKLEAVFLEGLPSDLLAAGPFVWHSRGKEALLTASVGLGGSEESATVGLYPCCGADLHTRLHHAAINTQMGFTGGCGAWPLCSEDWSSTGLLEKCGPSLTCRRKLLIKLNLRFYAGCSSGCYSQTSAVAAMQSGSANRSSASEENV